MLQVQVADPEDACANLSVPVLDSKPWIALIKRSERARADCSFDIKVSTKCQSPSTSLSACYALQDTNFDEGHQEEHGKVPLCPMSCLRRTVHSNIREVD